MRFQSRKRPNGLAANMLQSEMHARKRLQAETAAKLEALLRPFWTAPSKVNL